MKQFGEQLKSIAKKALGLKYYLIVIAAVVIGIVLIAGVVFIIKKDDAKNKSDDEKSAPHAVEEYTTNVTIDENGKITTSISADDLWKKMRKNNNRALAYLDNAAQLKKLMDAQIVTMYPDTRDKQHINEDIDWDKLLSKTDSKEIQGIIKVKRADTDGNIKTLTYMNPEQFQAYVDTGNKEALNYFTIEAYDSSMTSTDDGSTDDYTHYDGDAGKIIDAAAKRVGGKYVWGGNQWGSGPSDTAVDCSHFVWNVLKEAVGYSGGWHQSTDWKNYGKEVSSLSQAQAGDVIVYSGHVAIYDGKGGIYHASNSAPYPRGGIKHGKTANYKHIVAIRRFAADGTKVVDATASSADESSSSSPSSNSSTGSSSSSSSDSSSSSQSSSSASLKDFLVIGDSIAAAMDSKFTSEGATVVSAVGMTAKYFVDNFDSRIGGITKKPAGIVIILGQNSCGGNESYRESTGFTPLKELVSKLQKKFPDVTIYINSTIPTESGGYRGNVALNAATYLGNQKKLNEEVKAYCESTNNVNYINVLENYTDSNGYAKTDLTQDGLHPNAKGVDVLLKNVKAGISGNSSEESSEGDSNSGSSMLNKTQYYIKLATWQQTDTIETLDGRTTSSDSEYTLTTTNVNYQELVQKYQLPFEYLWSFLVLGQDYNLVSELADLVYNSKIEITAFDSLEVEKAVQTEKYETKTKKIDSETGEEKQITESHVETTTTITQTDTINTQTTLADVWYAKYSIDNDKLKFNKTDRSELDKNPTTNTESLPNSGNKINRTLTTSDKTITDQWKIPTMEVKEKTSKKAEKSNFVTIFCAQRNYDTRRSIVDGAAEWLFEMLEENESTKSFVDLTKYLFYKISDTNFGVTKFEFETFNPNDFSTPSSGDGSLEGGSELLKKFIFDMEGCTKQEGDKYIIQSDGYGNLAVGHGIDIYNGGFANKFKQAGYSICAGAKVDISFVKTLENQTLENNLKFVKSQTQGLNLTDYQIAALVSRVYNCGGRGLTERNGKTFKQAYLAYWNQERDDKSKNKLKEGDFTHSLYTQYMSQPNTASGQYSRGLEKRRKWEWTLFQTGYVTTENKWFSE